MFRLVGTATSGQADLTSASFENGVGPFGRIGAFHPVVRLLGDLRAGWIDPSGFMVWPGREFRCSPASRIPPAGFRLRDLIIASLGQ